MIQKRPQSGSDSERRRAIIIREEEKKSHAEANCAKSNREDSFGKKNRTGRLTTERLIDGRQHELPQKLMPSPPKSQNSSRKMSFLGPFGNILPGAKQDKKHNRKEKSKIWENNTFIREMIIYLCISEFVIDESNNHSSLSFSFSFHENGRFYQVLH